MRKSVIFGAATAMTAMVIAPLAASAQTTGTRIDVDRTQILVIGAIDDPENSLPVDETADADIPELPVVVEDEPIRD